MAVVDRYTVVVDDLARLLQASVDPNRPRGEFAKHPEPIARAVQARLESGHGLEATRLLLQHQLSEAITNPSSETVLRRGALSKSGGSENHRDRRVALS